MKKLLPTGILCLFLTVQSFAQSNDYVVQLAAFDQAVSLDYFKGLTGINHVKDHNDIHKYYLSGFSDESVAEASAQNAKNLGFNARVVNMTEVKNSCSLACGIAVDPLKVRSIFFDFDKYNLRGESRTQLDRLFNMMIEKPDYNVELSAHTDAKGSLEYNNTLSMNRAKAAQAYLIKKGLSSTRITISTFGENAPIAKNDLNGKDTPEGRQYNRRVELKVFNTNGSQESVVERINVPSELRH